MGLELARNKRYITKAHVLGSANESSTFSGNAMLELYCTARVTMLKCAWRTKLKLPFLTDSGSVLFMYLQ